MSYIFRYLEMVEFPHNHFIQVCRIQADSKLQNSRLILPLNKHKAVYPWGCFMYWFQKSHFQHHIYFLLESFFQVNWNWSTRGFLFCNIWIQLNMIWEIWEASNSIKYIRVSVQNLLYACHQLGNYLLSIRHCRFFLELWVDASFLELWTDTVDLVFFGWSTELIIKLALGSR